MPNTDESTREKQPRNELKEIASLGNHCAAIGRASFFGYCRESTGLRFKFPQRNLKACFMHLDGELMILMDLTLLN